jgi:hypothetical protein
MQSATPTIATIIAAVVPIADRPGRYAVHLAGRLLCVDASTPHLEAARALLVLGHSPRAILVTRRGDVVSLRSTVGAAARLEVRDDNQGRPKFRRWKAPARPATASPIAPADRPATSVHLHRSANA